MDKKTIIILVALAVAFFGYAMIYPSLLPPPPPKPLAPVVEQTPVAPSATPTVTAQSTMTAVAPPSPVIPPPPVDMERLPESFATLTTALQEIEFTSYGGAIKKITLLKREDGIIRAPLEFTTIKAPPLMATSGIEGLTADTAFELVEHDDSHVVFQSKPLPSGVVVKKVFSVSGDYQVACTLSIVNNGASTLEAKALEVSLGTASRLKDGSIYDEPGVDWHNGKVPRYDVRVGWFQPSSFLWIISIHGARDVYRASENKPDGNVMWGATKSQYFATILTPAVPAADLVARPVELPPPDAAHPATHGIAASLILQPIVVAPGQSSTQVFHVYCGPKEYNRLKKLGQNQDEVLEFGAWMGLVSKPLLWTLQQLHWLGLNYGVAIIVITILIKLVLWPISVSSMKSMKRMQKVQPLMTSLREKYKDDPAKLNQEMMKLYKEHKVNPLGGCLPMLVQLPVFFGLFGMLRGAIELRGSPFLWIHDLSQPDTVAHLGGIPLNPLPLLMTGATIWQQKITPTTVDPKQAKMMMFMPLIMLLFFYNASSGLALYWTAQQLLSVGQQYYMNRQPDEPTPPAPPPKKKKAK